jgi:hypothetical protein
MKPAAASIKDKLLDFLRLKGRKLIWIGRFDRGIEAITREVFTQQTTSPRA